MSKEIMAVKKQVRLENRAAEVKSCTSSGLTVQQWCRENGISPKTYYYHLCKVRESVIESTPAIVPLNDKVISSEKIEISDGEINIALPADMNIEALSTVIRVLSTAMTGKQTPLIAFTLTPAAKHTSVFLIVLLFASIK